MSQSVSFSDAASCFGFERIAASLVPTCSMPIAVQLRPTVCRHTVGLNYTSIGIEHVGTSDASILSNPKQLAASLKLTLWLMHRFDISLPNVIGHSESLTSPYHRERYAPWRCQTHGDWLHADMNLYRDDLAKLARAERVTVSRAGGPVRSTC